jgi:GH15 family glucan-1,4-alpha-glucosidase
VSIRSTPHNRRVSEFLTPTAQSWASEVDGLTYTTNGPYGSGSYYLRITPDGQPNAGTSIGIANGGGSHDDRTVIDPSFLELVRLGVKPASAADITNSVSVVDSQIQVSTPEGPIRHRYSFDGYGETASGGDYTGSGVGNPWPVLSGERGEYDVAAGNLTARSPCCRRWPARPTAVTSSRNRSGAARPAPAGSRSASRTIPPPH